LDRSSLSFERLAGLRLSLPALLFDFLRDKRWFGGKARRLASIEIEDIVPVEQRSAATVFVFARVAYESGPHETYVVPLLAHVAGDRSGAEPAGDGHDDLSVQLPLSDALQDLEVLRGLYDAIEYKSAFRGLHGEIRASQTRSFREISLPPGDTSTPKVITGEQSNSSSIFGNRSILKIFRRAQEGVNPELEVGRFLTERTHFQHIPPLGGSLEYISSGGTTMTLGVLQGFVPNEGDAWQYTLKSLPGFWREAPKYFQQISAQTATAGTAAIQGAQIPAIGYELCGGYLDAMALLGQRTAELHEALASDRSDAAFAPEPYTPAFQQEIRDGLSANAKETFDLLRTQVTHLPPGLRGPAKNILGKENEVVAMIREILSRPLSGMRIRIHGDYHLGQVLCAGGDFVIIDFEGEPGRPISDRIMKRAALQDVAGMLRSFHYAAFAPLLAPIRGVESPQGDDSQLSTLAECWNRWVSSRFLKAYFDRAASSGCLPEDDQEISSLLRLHLIGKALFELSYELNNRPEWVRIPLLGILRLLEHPNMLLP
jgi:trehalose synthase-fused probable maltokinase